MTCDACARQVKEVLDKPTVRSVEVNVEDQRVLVESTEPPSAITRMLKETGRTVIVRGLSYKASGKEGEEEGAPVPGETVAGVSILEHASAAWKAHEGKKREGMSRTSGGLARLVRAGPSLTLVDLTVHDFPEGTYTASIHSGGDVSDGPESCGEELYALGEVHVDAQGSGDLVSELPKPLWSVIGHGISVGGVSGVIARSSGVYENTKRVCACDGRTMWEEARLPSNM